MIDRRSLLVVGTAALAGCVTRAKARADLPLSQTTIRRAIDRGHANHGWLDSHHTFSFADYYDPMNMGFRALRVINEDRIQGAGGFPMHPHQNMEIVTYVLDGGLQHKDSIGNGGIIIPGEVQRMSAGTGIRHSEFNASASDQVHLLQIWLLPEIGGGAPSYEQKNIPVAERENRLRVIASKDGRDGSVVIKQDAVIAATKLAKGDGAIHRVRDGRNAWLQVARGLVKVNGELLEAGDAAWTQEPGRIEIVGEHDAEVLVFDLA